MRAREWLWQRSTELLGAICVAAILISGVWVGIPFLRARVAEVFFYSVSCLSAVVLRILVDLMIRSGVGITQAVRRLGSTHPARAREVPSAI